MKLSTLLILGAFCWYANTSIFLGVATVSARETKSDIITEAKLLTTYIKRYTERIKESGLIYPGIDRSLIEKSLKDTRDMIRSLESITQGNEDLFRAEYQISTIIAYIKKLNTELQDAIEIEKKRQLKELVLYRARYKKGVKSIQSLLEQFITQKSHHLLQKNQLTEEDRKLAGYLLELRLEAEKIGDIRYVSLLTKEQLRANIQARIIAIRSLLHDIRQLYTQSYTSK